MSIEAPVQSPVSRIVGTPWTYSRRLAANAALSVDIAAIPVTVKRDHRYKVTVSACGIMPSLTAQKRLYAVQADAEIITSVRLGFDQGGWGATLGIPIRLCGLWTATADASVSFKFTRTTQIANTEDELVVAYHQMWVEDLGHV